MITMAMVRPIFVVDPGRSVEDLDFIVIGSGMGGLWLSAALTKCGYKVLVLEQFLGGKIWEPKHGGKMVGIG